MKWSLQINLQEIMKKNNLGASVAWLMSHLSQRTSESAYYIANCQNCWKAGYFQNITTFSLQITTFLLKTIFLFYPGLFLSISFSKYKFTIWVSKAVNFIEILHLGEQSSEKVSKLRREKDKRISKKLCWLFFSKSHAIRSMHFQYF